MKNGGDNVLKRIIDRIISWLRGDEGDKSIAFIHREELEREFDADKSKYSYRKKYLRYLFGGALGSYNNCHKDCRKLLEKVLKDRLTVIDSFHKLRRHEVFYELLNEMFVEQDWEDFVKISKDLVRHEKELAVNIIKLAIYKGSMIAHPILVDLLMEESGENGALASEEEYEIYKIVDSVILAHIKEIKTLDMRQLLSLIRNPIARRYLALSDETKNPSTKKLYRLKAKQLYEAA